MRDRWHVGAAARAARLGSVSACGDRAAARMKMTPDSLTGESWIAIARARAGKMSGDCARVVSHPAGPTLFFLGDVAGHDARAARLAVELDARVSDLAASSGPAALLTQLNVALEASWPSDVFVSAVCFALDHLTGQGSIAVAGQLPPIVKGHSASQPLAAPSGPPLGVVADHGYDESAFALIPGDLLVAVTDGVTDPLGTGTDRLGLSALVRLVDRAFADPALLCASILAACRSGIDDATVLAIASPVCAILPPALIRATPPYLAA